MLVLVAQQVACGSICGRHVRTSVEQTSDILTFVLARGSFTLFVWTRPVLELQDWLIRPGVDMDATQSRLANSSRRKVLSGLGLFLLAGNSITTVLLQRFRPTKLVPHNTFEGVFEGDRVRIARV